MPNWSAVEASFLHLTQPQQLGELAACLARLKSWVKNSAKGEIVPVLLEESLLYLSLIQQNSEVNYVELTIPLPIYEGELMMLSLLTRCSLMFGKNNKS